MKHGGLDCLSKSHIKLSKKKNEESRENGPLIRFSKSQIAIAMLSSVVWGIMLVASAGYNRDIALLLVRIRSLIK